jgi:hypothetical protein
LSVLPTSRGFIRLNFSLAQTATNITYRNKCDFSNHLFKKCILNAAFRPPISRVR